MIIYFDKTNPNWVEGGNNYQYVVEHKRKFIEHVLRTGHYGSVATFKDMLGFDSEEISNMDRFIGWDIHSIVEFEREPVVDFGIMVAIVVTD